MKYVWVIGASTGIGEAVALQYFNLGYQVYISARTGAKLEQLAAEHNQYDESDGEGMLIPIEMDVTDEFSVGSAVQRIQDIHGRLHKVIVNAGTCEYIDDTQVALELVKRVMDTNLYGAMRVSNYVQPLLDHDEASQLVFISSSVTYQALPRAHAYGGSKAALRYFAQCLKMDIQHEGVDVRVVSPGFVKTPLTDKNDFDMPFMISSEDAANRIVKGLEGSNFDIHFPKRFTYTLKLFSLLPDAIKFYLLGKVSRANSDSMKDA